MNYKILSALSLDELQEEVQKHLNDGWRLNGDLKTCINTQYNRINIRGVIEKSTYVYDYIQAVWYTEPFIGGDQNHELRNH